MIDGHDPGPISRRSLVATLLAVAGSLLARPAAAELAPLGRLLPRPKAAAPWDDRFEVAITFDVTTPDGGRRPYVVVFVESLDGKPVRTVGIWIQKGRRSWIRQLRHWFRLERDRQVSGGAGDLADTLSSPTRRAGTYTMVWDGRSDTGEPVELGTYGLGIEAVRERGTYQLIRSEFTFDAKPFAEDLEGNLEIGGARVEYRERA
jgi:FAD:protein FMN transferase